MDSVRRRPCPTCPYRRDVPSGIWSEEEYALLPLYDGDGVAQYEAGAFRVFDCHAADGHLCAGWAGHREDPNDLLALRLAVARGAVDPEALLYSTRVPLFPSGAEAARHGLRDILNPGRAAREAIAKIARAREARGNPVRHG